MARHRTTGDGIDYDDAESAAAEAAAERAFENYDGGGGPVGGSDEPTRLHVTARIEWAGVDDGPRTTTLDGLNLGPVRDALDRVHRAERRERRERGASGWSAQLRALTGSAQGSEAADRAGLDVTKQTLTRWLTESQAPSKANRDRIAAAYADMRGDRAERASDNVREARREFGETLTRATAERYGANVRFRDIEDFRFLD